MISCNHCNSVRIYEERREQYGKMEPKYPEAGHCQSVLRPRGRSLTSLYILKYIFVVISNINTISPDVIYYFIRIVSHRLAVCQC